MQRALVVAERSEHWTSYVIHQQTVRQMRTSLLFRMKHCWTVR